MVGDVRPGSFSGNPGYLGAMAPVLFLLPVFDSNFRSRALDGEG